MVKQFAIEFTKRPNHYRIERYILPTGSIITFDENKGEIDLNPLKIYVGKKFDAYNNGEYEKSYRLLDVYKINDENNIELLAIKYE